MDDLERRLLFRNKWVSTLGGSINAYRRPHGSSIRLSQIYRGFLPLRNEKVIVSTTSTLPKEILLDHERRLTLANDVHTVLAEYSPILDAVRVGSSNEYRSIPTTPPPKLPPPSLPKLMMSPPRDDDDVAASFLTPTRSPSPPPPPLLPPPTPQPPLSPLLLPPPTPQPATMLPPPPLHQPPEEQPLLLHDLQPLNESRRSSRRRRRRSSSSSEEEYRRRRRFRRSSSSSSSRASSISRASSKRHSRSRHSSSVGVGSSVVSNKGSNVVDSVAGNTLVKEEEEMYVLFYTPGDDNKENTEAFVSNDELYDILRTFIQDISRSYPYVVDDIVVDTIFTLDDSLSRLEVVNMLLQIVINLVVLKFAEQIHLIYKYRSYNVWNNQGLLYTMLTREYNEYMAIVGEFNEAIRRCVKKWDYREYVKGAMAASARIAAYYKSPSEGGGGGGTDGDAIYTRAVQSANTAFGLVHYYNPFTLMYNLQLDFLLHRLTKLIRATLRASPNTVHLLMDETLVPSLPPPPSVKNSSTIEFLGSLFGTPTPAISYNAAASWPPSTSTIASSHQQRMLLADNVRQATSALNQKIHEYICTEGSFVSFLRSKPTTTTGGGNGGSGGVMAGETNPFLSPSDIASVMDDVPTIHLLGFSERYDACMNILNYIPAFATRQLQGVSGGSVGLGGGGDMRLVADEIASLIGYVLRMWYRYSESYFIHTYLTASGFGEITQFMQSVHITTYDNTGMPLGLAQIMRPGGIIVSQMPVVSMGRKLRSLLYTLMIYFRQNISRPISESYTKHIVMRDGIHALMRDKTSHNFDHLCMLMDKVTSKVMQPRNAELTRKIADVLLPRLSRYYVYSHKDEGKQLLALENILAINGFVDSIVGSEFPDLIIELFNRMTEEEKEGDTTPASTAPSTPGPESSSPFWQQQQQQGQWQQQQGQGQQQRQQRQPMMQPPPPPPKAAINAFRKRNIAMGLAFS